MKNKLTKSKLTGGGEIDFLEIVSYGRKNKIKGILIGTILGGIIFGGIGAAAVTLTAEQITYTSSNEEFTASNAKEAIDELYSLSTELVGKSEIIDLGTGTSFDLISYEGYENFTINDFVIVSEDSLSVGLKSAFNGGSNLWPSANYQTIKSYDANEGVLTAYGKITLKMGSSNGQTWGPWTATQNVHVYLILNKS